MRTNRRKPTALEHAITLVRADDDLMAGRITFEEYCGCNARTWNRLRCAGLGDEVRAMLDEYYRATAPGRVGATTR